MSVLTILEGAWEEIREHDELAGHFVRVQVLPGPNGRPSNRNEGKSVAEMFAGRIGTLSFEPTDLAENADAYLAKYGFGKSSMGEDEAK